MMQTIEPAGSVSMRGNDTKTRGPIHVVLVGAGEVCRATVTSLLSDHKAKLQLNKLRVTVIARKDSTKPQQILAEAREARNGAYGYIDWAIAGHMQDVRQANLVVMMAHQRLSETEATRLVTEGVADRRSLLSFGNKAIVREYASQLAAYAPGAYLLVATNQSDEMAAIARQYVGDPRLVLGFGGQVDTERYRILLSNHISRLPQSSSKRLWEAVKKQYVFGYHNDLMAIQGIDGIPMQSLNALLSETIQQGHRIATIGETPKTPSELPGRCLADTIIAFAGLDTSALITPMNVLIENQKAADNFGVPVNTGLSIPTSIEAGKIRPLEKFTITDALREKLSAAANEMQNRVDAIESYVPGMPMRVSAPVGEARVA